MKYYLLNYAFDNEIRTAKSKSRTDFSLEHKSQYRGLTDAVH